jgi:membrane-associated phospholipid phosphatase
MRPLPHRFLLFALLIGTASWADQASKWNSASNASTASVALLAGGITWMNGDIEGAKELMLSSATAVGAAEVLKNTVHEQRPDGSDRKSFPSAHTTLAFSAATYIDKRYGDSYGLLTPAVYGLASFTGLARVQSKSHHLGDVLAGGALGYGSSVYFTQPVNGGRMSLAPLPGGAMIAWSKPL